MSLRTRREMRAFTAKPVTDMIVAVTVMPVAVMPVAVSVETLLWRFVSFINPEEVDCRVFLTVSTEQVVVDFLMTNFFAHDSILTTPRCSCAERTKVINVTWLCFDDIIFQTIFSCMSKCTKSKQFNQR